MSNSDDDAPTRDSPAFMCAVCAEVFDRGDLYHCRTCDHHYRVGDGECSNCRKPARKRPDMKKTGLTIGQYDKAIDREDARKLRACEKISMRVDPDNLDDLVAYILLLNRRKKHLSPHQMAMTGARMKKIYAKQDKEKQEKPK